MKRNIYLRPVSPFEPIRNDIHECLTDCIFENSHPTLLNNMENRVERTPEKLSIRQIFKNYCFEKRRATIKLKGFLKLHVLYFWASLICLYIFYYNVEVLQKIEYYSEIITLTAEKEGNAHFKENLKKTELSVNVRSAINSNGDVKRCDFALESSGGEVLSIRFTKPYGVPVKCLYHRLLHKIKNILPSSTEKARVILQPSMEPGNCWAFDGSEGSVIVKLYGNVYISAVTLQHISADISPTNEISSAPKEFSVTGLILAGDSDGYSFGKFTYDIDRSPIQYFEVNNKAKHSYNIVKIDFHSNWGNSYTCVYRIQIHGILDKNG